MQAFGVFVYNRKIKLEKKKASQSPTLAPDQN